MLLDSETGYGYVHVVSYVEGCAVLLVPELIKQQLQDPESLL